MKAFYQLVVSQVKMLFRDRSALIGSFGIAFISMLLFGLLFGPGGSGTFNLGIVDEDNTIVAQRIISSLESSEALKVTKGDRKEELTSLEKGERRAVMVINSGFEKNLAQGRATLKVYYDRSNPVAMAMAASVVQSIVAGINRSITQASEPIQLQQEEVLAKRLRNIDFLTPGMVGMMIMWTNMFVGAGVIAWRERGILKRLGVTALQPFKLISSKIIAHLIFSLLQAAILLATAKLLFDVSIEGNYLLLLVVIVAGSLSLLSTGFIIGSFLRSSEGANSVSMLISFPMMFLGGSYFPVEGAPDFIQPIIKVIPLTYLNHALRQIINNGADFAVIQTDLLVLMVWMVVSLVISTRFFRWQ